MKIFDVMNLEAEGYENRGLMCFFKMKYLTAMPRSLPPLSLPCSQSESVGGR